MPGHFGNSGDRGWAIQREVEADEQEIGGAEGNDRDEERFEAQEGDGTLGKGQGRKPEEGTATQRYG